jgi:hypothetical protein
MFLDEMDKPAVIARALWRVLGRTKAVQVSAQIQAMAKLENKRSWAAPPLDQAANMVPEWKWHHGMRKAVAKGLKLSSLKLVNPDRGPS